MIARCPCPAGRGSVSDKLGVLPGIPDEALCLGDVGMSDYDGLRVDATVAPR